MWAIGFKPFGFADFDAGDSADGYILYEVPKDVTNFTLVYELYDTLVFGIDNAIEERYEIPLQ